MDYSRREPAGAYPDGVRGLRRGCRFRERSYKFWREAWVASLFITRTAPRWARTDIRLTPEGSPLGDFQIDNGSIHTFEIAEVLDAVSQPIWKKMEAAGETVLPERADAVSGALAREKIPELIGQKSAKPYPPSTGLILYVNLWTWFETEDLHALVPLAPGPFSSIWLLASDKATDLLTL